MLSTIPESTRQGLFSCCFVLATPNWARSPVFRGFGLAECEASGLSCIVRADMCVLGGTVHGAVHCCLMNEDRAQAAVVDLCVFQFKQFIAY